MHPRHLDKQPLDNNDSTQFCYSTGDIEGGSCRDQKV